LAGSRTITEIDGGSGSIVTRRFHFTSKVTVSPQQQAIVRQT